VADIEKVKQGIKACWSEHWCHKCFNCPYKPDRDNDDTCVERLGADTLELLKEKQPRVIDRALLRAYLGCAVWLERVTYEPLYVGIITTIHEPSYAISIINADEMKEQLCLDFYGATWRCWTSKPTVAQQNAEKWDGDSK